jgi:hypothetical protein
VAGTRRLARVRVVGDGAALLETLAAEGVALRRFALDGAGALAVFSPDDVPDLGRVERALALRFPGCVTDAVGEVALVGPGAGSDPALVVRALAAASALAPVGDAAPIACETTPMRLSLFLDGARVDDLVRALHAAVITDGGPA